LTFGLGAYFGVCYFTLQRVVLFVPHQFALSRVDRAVSFDPRWTVVYLSVGLFVLLPLGGDLRRYTRGFFVLTIISFVFFLVFPVEGPRPDQPAANAVYRLLIAYDRNLNAFPSLHAALTVYTFLFIARIRPRSWIAPMGVWLVLILYSALATKQQFAIGVLAGVVVAIAADFLASRRPAVLAIVLFALAGCHPHKPTVVFEAGLGDTHDSWRAVVRRIAPSAPVFTYDRAGLGTSAPATSPRTPTNIARELHARLQSEHVRPPYVLVSHSAGAWYALRFASDYPGEVAALIMVDPTPFDFFTNAGREMEPAERQRFTQQTAEYAQHASPGRRAEWDARLAAAIDASHAKLRAGLPVTIITGATRQSDRSERIRAWWLARHAAWAKTFPRGRHVIAETGHYVQLENPELVSREILTSWSLSRPR